MEEYWTTFLGKNAYPVQLQRDLAILEVGKRYKIIGGSIGSSSSSLVLEGVNGSCNSVMFDADIDNIPILVNDYK